MGKSPRGWTGARTPSAIKRVRQAERRRAVNQPRKSAAKTFVANAIKVGTNGADGEASTALAAAMSALDRAAKVGAIHPNAAARRKSRLTLKLNALAGGVAVPATGRVTKTTGTAAAVKAARTRIATAKATKAKGPQTAAGKARAALSKTARDSAQAAAAATAAEPAAPKKTRSTATTATAAKPAKTATRAAAKTPTTERASSRTSTSKAAKPAAGTEAPKPAPRTRKPKTES